MKRAVKRRFLILALLGAAAIALAPPASSAAEVAPRVVTLGGSVTEIVFALGQGGHVVGTDESSLYPEAVNALARVGYYRAVPIEGVAALRPDLVLASEQSGPREAIERLGQLGIRVQTVTDRPSVDSLNERIQSIAAALNVPARGAQLIEQINTSLADVAALPSTHARALLVMNRSGSLQGAGAHTGADLVLKLAGLDNVLAREKAYVPLSAEGLVTLAPQVIVITQASLGATGGLAKLRATPGLAQSPAVQNDCIVVMDDLLALGSGPRLPQAAQALKNEPCIAELAQRAPSR